MIPFLSSPTRLVRYAAPVRMRGNVTCEPRKSVNAGEKGVTIGREGKAV